MHNVDFLVARSTYLYEPKPVVDIVTVNQVLINNKTDRKHENWPLVIVKNIISISYFRLLGNNSKHRIYLNELKVYTFLCKSNGSVCTDPTSCGPGFKSRSHLGTLFSISEVQFDTILCWRILKRSKKNRKGAGVGPYLGKTHCVVIAKSCSNGDA